MQSANQMPEMTESELGLRSPFWGLKLSFQPETRVLVIEDRLDLRQPVFERLFEGCHVSWAATIDSVRTILEAHGPFDVYCLDYDLDDAKGGWLPVGKQIREYDPRSIAKVVLIHSANTDAREYFKLFPAAIFIQWDVLATIIGIPLITTKLIATVLAKTGSTASVEQLRDTVIRLRDESPGLDDYKT